ncbi:unnamed protein product [Clonostachys rosea]|uniref:Uncharacterized protein n=1 Tax=Bionectria ochroleuca TaxID=29856 RepID=A0ABY6TXL0_BIOOC|nr:unnamed protein product [Clonostachys rosea]
MATALNIGQTRYKAPNASNGSEDLPVRQSSRQNVPRRDRWVCYPSSNISHPWTIVVTGCQLSAFSLPSDDLATQKIQGFNELAILDSQEDTGETLEALRFMTGRSSQLEFTPKSAVDVSSGPEPASLESRVDFILRSIQSMGFETPDSFMLSYYTGCFDERSAVKVAQDTSRTTGLPRMLHELRSKTEDWSRWESRSYADSVVRSAAKLIAEEFDSLGRKKYVCERELEKGLMTTTTSQTQNNLASSADGSASISQLYLAAAELKKTLRDEV